ANASRLIASPEPGGREEEKEDEKKEEREADKKKGPATAGTFLLYAYATLHSFTPHGANSGSPPPRHRWLPQSAVFRRSPSRWPPLRGSRTECRGGTGRYRPAFGVAS